MTKKSYKEKLLDPRWQKRRLEILSRDDFKCCECGNDKNTLHVHHCGYSKQFRNPWEYPDGWLITLCKDCHKEETEYLDIIKENTLNVMSSYGFTTSDYNNLCDVLMECYKRKIKPDYLMSFVLNSNEGVVDV
jgi:hypothetical protein